MEESREAPQSHVLLRNATRKPYREIPELPEGSTYDDQAGVWQFADGRTLVKDAAFPPKETKKCDQETGEDQKGT
jgi:hypothetical protein